MTVCVAVKVNDCIVFSADSASTLSKVDNTGRSVVLNVYNNADKVFKLHRKLPLVAMTCGMGHFGIRSISNLSKELRQDLIREGSCIEPSDYTVEEVAKRAQKFFKQKYDADPNLKSDQDFFEFWIGGYGSDNEHGEIWKISIIAGSFFEPEQLSGPDAEAGIHWGGQGEAIARLVIGIDPSLIGVLCMAGTQQELAQRIFQVGRETLETRMSPPQMPTKDAILLAKFLVTTTIGYFSFKFGSNIVGGVPDVATVTKFEGFKWIERKHYYPEELNR